MPDIAIVPTGGTDQWGDPLPAGDPVVIRRAKMWPLTSEEIPGLLTVGVAALIPPNKPVPTAADAVQVGVEVDTDGEYVAGTGVEYQVIGDPGAYFSGGNGPLKATIVNLERRS